MIEINLLPEEMRKKQSALSKIDFSKLNINMQNINLQGLPLVKIGAIAAGGFVALEIVLLVLGFFGHMSYESLAKRYKDILPRKQEADRIKVQTETMNKKIAAIDELMVKRFSWAKKLNQLSDSMTPGIWLTEVSYEEKVGERTRPVEVKSTSKKKGAEPPKPVVEKVLLRYLVISGDASSMTEEETALIGRFIKSLKSNTGFYSDFSDIELGSIKGEKVEGQEAMTFKITCLFK